MKKLIFLCFIGLITFESCKKDNEGATPAEVLYDSTPYDLDYGTFPEPPIAEDNELTQAKVFLGRMLFYEKKLSALENQSCASCHRQSAAFSDTAQFSEGTFGDLGERQTMAIVNLAWNTNGFFWDGRSETLRHQSLQPIQNPIEMAETLESVVNKISVEPMYRDQFIRAFGDPTVTPERMSLAMEQFMSTMVSTQSKYDRYIAGLVTLSESEERGRQLFFAEYNPFFPEVSGADCAHCHSGFNFENGQYMNNGLDTHSEFTDMGRYDHTGNETNRAKFKVPTLRNIEVSGPYMHAGRFTTLEEVVDHYNEGIQLSSTVDPAIANTQTTGLMLSPEDKADLVNFMKTLTDETFLNNEELTNPF